MENILMWLAVCFGVFMWSLAPDKRQNSQFMPVLLIQTAFFLLMFSTARSGRNLHLALY